MNRQDKAFMTVFAAVIGMLMVVGLVFLIMARIISGTADRGYDRSAQMAAATSERLKPVGHAVVAGSKEAKAEQAKGGQKSAAAPGKHMTGKQVYQHVCSACHAVGALGAPKFGDKAAWAPRYKQGLSTLLDHALHGYKKMPAKGGHPSLTQQNVHDAIVYMLSHSGINVPKSSEGGNGASKSSAGAASTKASSGATATASQKSSTSKTGQPAPSGSKNHTSKSNSASESTGSGAQSANSQTGGGGKTQNNATNGFTIPAGIDMAKGKNTYEHVCIACHGTGVAGAPKFGNKSAWAPRIAKGWDTLKQHALHGFKGMPPKGGRPDLPDEQILDAMAYMTSHSS